MKIKIILLLLPLLLLSCSNRHVESSPTISESVSEQISEESLENLESEESIEESSSEEISKSEESTSIEESSEESESSEPTPSEESIESKESIEESEYIESESEEFSEESDYIEESEEYTIPASGQTLPIGDGNKTITGPDNLKNPIDISDWQEFDFYNSIPAHWSYIQGNNKVNSRGDFYAESAGGGFKFSHLYYGLQTPVLTSWVKIEILFHISTVQNNSKKKDVDEPIFHIYGYNNKGRYIDLTYLEQGKITKKQEGNDVRVYVRNIDICYLEFRLNAFPYTGSQCYNFGVDKISIKGWQWE